jgi:hypothetical protein
MLTSDATSASAACLVRDEDRVRLTGFVAIVVCSLKCKGVAWEHPFRTSGH